MRSIIAGVLAAVSAAGAQELPTVLQIPAGARALGVGDAFVAGRSAEVIFYNPAQMALQPGINASLQRFGSASTSGSLASIFALPGGAAGVGIQFLEYGEGALGARDSSTALASRGPLNAYSIAVSFALGLPPFKTVRSGITAKFVEERLGASRDGGAAFDVGLAKDVFGRGTLALAAQNLGPALHIDGVEANLPMRLTLGGAYAAPPLRTWFDLAGSASLSYLRDGTLVPAAGVELTYVPLDGWGFTGRAGLRRTVGGSDARPLTLGAGVSLDRVSLDYAFNALEPGGASHRVGLRIR
jgi:hypothetical protein